jgi:nucleosome binding factor SPN SPT16 subunit
MVDAPPKVESIYATLVSLYTACLESMVPGNELKDVLEAAKAFLKKKDASLLPYLPKTLGFAIGLEFRDSTMLLNNVNTTKFSSGMVVNLAVGFHNVPLDKGDTEKSPEVIKKLGVFSMLLADVVAVQAQGIPDVLTKVSKEFGDVSYSISGDNKVSSLSNVLY